MSHRLRLTPMPVSTRRALRRQMQTLPRHVRGHRCRCPQAHLSFFCTSDPAGGNCTVHLKGSIDVRSAAISVQCKGPFILRVFLLAIFMYWPRMVARKHYFVCVVTTLMIVHQDKIGKSFLPQWRHGGLAQVAVQCLRSAVLIRQGDNDTVDV